MTLARVPISNYLCQPIVTWNIITSDFIMCNVTSYYRVYAKLVVQILLICHSWK